jgi:hypothetical protein
MALALALAILGPGRGLAHAQSQPQAGQPSIAPGLLPPVPNNSFICHAQPGGWCDLWDWGPSVRPPRD